MLTVTTTLVAGWGMLPSTVYAADIELRVMETTDLHMHALNFDYHIRSSGTS